MGYLKYSFWFSSSQPVRCALAQSQALACVQRLGLWRVRLAETVDALRDLWPDLYAASRSPAPGLDPLSAVRLLAAAEKATSALHRVEAGPRLRRVRSVAPQLMKMGGLPVAAEPLG